ncbi:MAG: very short patch repair endonuclease [Candidatus Paceibacterota bacterium]
MSLIRSKDTKPELLVRKLAFSAGYRYRLHDRTLPGKPDLVFSSRRKVIFVHGCFWHLHRRCKAGRIPRSRVDYWKNKLEGNRRRDALHKRRLTAMGWRYLVIWECQTAKIDRLSEGIIDFLES